MAGLGYHIQKTGDGSMTLYSVDHDDFMHSLTGGLTEALAMHVDPSRVFSTFRDRTVIFDIGFGLGYNSLAALERWLQLDYPGNIYIHAFERDERIIPFIMDNFSAGTDKDRYSLIKDAVMKGKARFTRHNHYFELSVHFGDARQTLPAITDQAQAVFQDPYTPSKNPELWTVDFFLLLKDRMEGAGFLTTYSRAPQVRGALSQAGFFLGSGPSSGMKREGTLASPDSFNGCFQSDEILEFLTDHRSVPYKDPMLKASPEEILENRIVEMKIFRDKNRVK